MSEQAIELVAERFRVLSESTRLRIVNQLREGEMSVSELTNQLGTSQPNVSKHLRMLTDAGLLRRDQRGNTVYYSIADKSIFDLCDVVCGSLEGRLKEQAAIFLAA